MDIFEIGQNIRYQRKRRGLKQAVLAEMVGVSSQHISHIECGKTAVSLALLIKIANALNTDANTLLGSNLRSKRTAILAGELAELLTDADKQQLSLCVELCRTVMKVSNEARQ